jgi:hypothetical protein
VRWTQAQLPTMALPYAHVTVACPPTTGAARSSARHPKHPGEKFFVGLGHANVLATGSGLGPLLTGFQRRHHL